MVCEKERKKERREVGEKRCGDTTSVCSLTDRTGWDLTADGWTDGYVRVVGSGCLFWFVGEEIHRLASEVHLILTAIYLRDGEFRLTCF